MEEKDVPQPPIETVTVDNFEGVRDIFQRCSEISLSPLLDLCNNCERNCVVITDPEIIPILFHVGWRESHIKTLYLLNESDDKLQTGIRYIAQVCSNKLFLRIFSSKISPSPSLPFGQWESILASDDRSPPFKRVLVVAFRLADMSIEDRDAFFDKARHAVGDMIVFERTNSSLPPEKLSSEIRHHLGIPHSHMIQSSNKEIYGMTARFFHQGEGDLRHFTRKGYSENNLASLSPVRML